MSNEAEKDAAALEVAALLSEWSAKHNRGWVLVFERSSGNVAVLHAMRVNAEEMLTELAARIKAPAASTCFSVARKPEGEAS